MRAHDLFSNLGEVHALCNCLVGESASHQCVCFSERGQAAREDLRHFRRCGCCLFTEPDYSGGDGEEVLKTVAHFLCENLLLVQRLLKTLFGPKHTKRNADEG